MQETIFARNTDTGETREFTKLIWDQIIDSSDAKGNLIPKSGWVPASRPTETPKAALEAEAAAAAESARKEKEMKSALDAKIIGEVEAKVIQGVNEEFDYKSEIRPYLDAKGWTVELGKLPLKEVIMAIRKKLAVK